MFPAVSSCICQERSREGRNGTTGQSLLRQEELSTCGLAPLSQSAEPPEGLTHVLSSGCPSRNPELRRRVPLETKES